MNWNSNGVLGLLQSWGAKDGLGSFEGMCNLIKTKLLYTEVPLYPLTMKNHKKELVLKSDTGTSEHFVKLIHESFFNLRK